MLNDYWQDNQVADFQITKQKKFQINLTTRWLNYLISDWMALWHGGGNKY